MVDEVSLSFDQKMPTSLPCISCLCHLEPLPLLRSGVCPAGSSDISTYSQLYVCYLCNRRAAAENVLGACAGQKVALDGTDVLTQGPLDS